MTLAVWDPITELRKIEDTMSRLWRHSRPDGDITEAWSIPLDVMEDGDNIVVRASMPGIPPDKIKVQVENNVLTVRGEEEQETERREGRYLMRERRFGSFYRALRLPENVDTDHATTVYENGVLTVTFPKMQTRNAKQLKVEAGGKGKTTNGKKT
jgi:HSP20 family protein